MCIYIKYIHKKLEGKNPFVTETCADLWILPDYCKPKRRFSVKQYPFQKVLYQDKFLTACTTYYKL